MPADGMSKTEIIGHFPTWLEKIFVKLRNTLLKQSAKGYRSLVTAKGLT
jgi:hypothetical protein